jgi:hypothetical protein
MNQRTTGLVVGLVIFVILTVGLLASTIYFNIEMNNAKQSAKNAADSQRSAQSKEAKTREAFGALAGFVTGDSGMSPESELEGIKKALGAEKVANLKVEFEGLRSKADQLAQDNDNLKKQAAAAQADATSARAEARKATEGADAAKKLVEANMDTYRTSVEKYGSEVKDTVAAVTKAQDEMDQRHRNEVADLQGQIDNVSSSRAELSGRVAEMQKVVDQYRIKPENAASLADGRVIDVAGQNGEVFISIGSKQRVQPGMTFDVYDSASSIQYNPTTGELIPGKARIQVLKVEENTSTARVIPEAQRFGARVSIGEGTTITTQTARSTGATLRVETLTDINVVDKVRVDGFGGLALNFGVVDQDAALVSSIDVHGAKLRNLSGNLELNTRTDSDLVAAVNVASVGAIAGANANALTSISADNSINIVNAELLEIGRAHV